MTYSLKEIKEIIKKDKQEKQGKYYARRYYNYKPSALFPDTSTSYEKDIVDQTGKVVTITKDRNPNLNTNFTKLLVNQKIDYMLANEPTIKSMPNQYTIVELSDMLEDMALTASLDVLSWMFFYVKDNMLRWVLVPDCQVKPIYDDFGVEIVQIIRYYDIEKITHVEIWDITGVRILKFTSENNHDVIIQDEEKTHYTVKKYYNNEVVSEEAKNLPFIPFVCMKNNKNLENDIECIKDQLDFYDIITSGFVSNIFKFQEMLMKLQGFTGDDTFYDDTMKKMKKYKMICLPDNETDAGYMSVEIPTEAREIILTALRENIFKIGQGFDPDKIGDGNITNIVIINRYSALNSKSDKTIKQLKIFYEKFIDCVNKFYRTQLGKDLICNKSANWNESEIIDNCVKSVDIIPDEIIIENHPWIKDSKKAIEMMKKQKEESIIDYNNPSNFNNNVE
jgi:hypothetical protein